MCDEMCSAGAVQERLQALCGKIGHEWGTELRQFARCRICDIRRTTFEATVPEPVTLIDALKGLGLLQR